jgi:hypothetical protein
MRLRSGICTGCERCVWHVMLQKSFCVLDHKISDQLTRHNLALAALVVAAMDEAWCPQTLAAPSAHYKTALIVDHDELSVLPAALDCRGNGRLFCRRRRNTGDPSNEMDQFVEIAQSLEFIDENGCGSRVRLLAILVSG